MWYHKLWGALQWDIAWNSMICDIKFIIILFWVSWGKEGPHRSGQNPNFFRRFRLMAFAFWYCIKSVVSEILQYDDKDPPFPILWKAFAKLYTVIDCLSFAQHWLQHQQPHQQLLASKSEKVSFLIKNFFSPQTHRVVESMERNRLVKMVASNATNLPYFMSAGSSASITQSDLWM